MEVSNPILSFIELVESRRSIRLFDKTPVPSEVIHKAIDLALLSPNSSNLQPWEFYWVQDPVKKTKLIEACLSQAAANTAAELIVCVARTATWRRNCDHMRQEIQRAQEQGIRIPKAAILYYNTVAPWMYEQGPLNLLGYIKQWIAWILGWLRPISREPFGKAGMRLWATKTTALACQTFMLAIRAYGFDTCPMEGIDSYRIRKILNLPKDSLIPMVIAVGQRRPDGVTLPRIRAPRDWFVKIV